MAADPIIDEIKHKLDIVDVVGRYMTLKKSGANWKSPCPFHPEKTPSFMVNRERQSYRCFGCGEAGDIFSFVMKQENVDFPSALELLAGQAGVILPERTAGSGGPSKKSLTEINDLAAKFFHYILTEHASGKEARDYLKTRGVSDASIKAFQIGYAPQNNAALRQLFAKNKFASNMVQQAGSPERFRHRLMFPFRDVVGNVIGFAGRALGEEMPKYLNTAETTLFHKNRFLYGLFEAKKEIGTAGTIVLVEGQLDVVLAHQAGTPQAIATSGTALTEEHFKAMRRYAPKVVIAYDGDGAGQKATERAIRLAAIDETEILVAQLPQGRDPGDMASTDAEAWKKLIASPVQAIDWLFSYYFAGDTKQLAKTERATIYDAIFPYIKLITDGVTQAYALQRLSRLMGITDDATVKEAFTTWQPSVAKTKAPTTSSAPVVAAPPAPAKPRPLNEQEQREKHLVGLVLTHPELLAYNELILDPTDLTSSTFATLYTKAQTMYTKGTTQSSELIQSVESTLSDSAKTPFQTLIFETQTLVDELSPDQLLSEYTISVERLRHRRKEGRMQDFAQRIAQAEASGNRADVVRLMQEMQASLKQPPSS